MEKWETKLVSSNEIEKFLKSKGKNRQWFHNLSSRGRNLLPSPIVHPKMEVVRPKNKPPRFVTRGRIILYPEGILQYLLKIILLKDQEGLTYKEISEHEEIRKELNKLNLLKETELKDDPRVKDKGFLINFEAACIFLSKTLEWNDNSFQGKFLNTIKEDSERDRKAYYNVNKEMRKQAIEKGAIEDGLSFSKQCLGQALNHYYSVMEQIIAKGNVLRKGKNVSLKEWYEPVREADK